MNRAKRSNEGKNVEKNDPAKNTNKTRITTTNCNRVATTRYNSEITVSLPQNLMNIEVWFSADLSSYSRGVGEQKNLEGKEQND